MDQDSYWHGYLMARHQVFMWMGIVLVAMTVIFTLTGQCLVKYRGIVSRAEDPKTFWQKMGIYLTQVPTTSCGFRRAALPNI